MCGIFKKSKFKASKIVQMAFFTFWNQPKLISRKIRVAGKLHEHRIDCFFSILQILLLVGLYVYFFVVRRQPRHHKSKSSGVNVDLPAPNGSAASDNSSFDDAKNSSSNQLVPQISTISSVYKTVQNGSSSTSFANGITPTYWSASQLLKEHEERKMRENAAVTNAAGMSSIAEENAGYDYQSEPYHG